MSEIQGYLGIGLSNGLVYGLLALGIVLLYKGSRVLNFAHPYFGLLAAYVCWWLSAKASFPPFSWLPFGLETRPRIALAMVLALVFIGLYGRGVEHGIMRKLSKAPRLVQLVATIALAQGAVGLTQLVFERTDEQASQGKAIGTVLWPSAGFRFGTHPIDAADLQVLIVVPLVCIAAALFFTRTRFGIAVRAAAENGEAARLLGISSDRVSTFVWVVGSVLAGLAGILITQSRGTLDLAILSTGFLIRGLAASLVGGLTSLPGALAGGIIVGLVEAFANYGNSKIFDGEYAGTPDVLLFVLVVAFLIFRPGGLFGDREETEDKVAFIPTLRALPARLQGTFASTAVRVLGAIVVLFAFVLALLTAGPSTTELYTRTVIIAIVGVSLTVLMGYSGQISLGQWGMAGVGAYAMANLYSRNDVPYLLALPLVVVIGMVVSLLIGLPALRIRGLYLAVVTLAFNLAAEFFIFKSELVGQGTAGIIIDPPHLALHLDIAGKSLDWNGVNFDSFSRRPLFILSVIVLLLCVFVARGLAKTRTGRGFYALRENEKAAATLGVGLTRYRLLAFAVSGGMASLAGALYGTFLGRAEATNWPTSFSLLLVAIVMIGGIGSLLGSVLGAFLVIALPQLIHFDNPWIVPIGTGILLLVVLIRAQGGLAGLVQRLSHGMTAGLDQLGQQQAAAPPPPAPTTTGS